MRQLHSLRTLFVFILLTATSLAGAPAFGQAYMGELHFLEEFAVKLYSRGDIPSATKEFQRLANIDPTNSTAQKYLDAIKAGKGQSVVPMVSSLQRIDNITSDISALKGEIIHYEADIKDLERMIRDLITENDALYVMLSKRTREVIDLRSKFEGTPYADQYVELMKTLPIDRVPQRLHRTGEESVFSSTSFIDVEKTPATTTETNDLNALSIEIVQQQEELLALQSSGTIDQQKAAQLEISLKEKRALLADKTQELMEKKGTSLQFKDKLSDVNTKLKGMNDRYRQNLQNIDRLSQNIKAELAQKNFSAQKQYADLLVDYSAKIKEIESLRLGMRARDEAFAALKNDLANRARNISGIDTAIDTKDQEIMSARTLLAQYKATIDRQAAELRFAHEQLDKTGKRISSIENSMLQNGQEMSRLGSKLQSTTVGASRQTNDQMTTSIESQARMLTTRYAQSAEPRALTSDNDATEKLAELRNIIAKKSTEISHLEKQIRTMAAQSVQSQAIKLSPASDDNRAKISELREMVADKASAIASLEREQRKSEAALTALENRLMKKDEALSKLEDTMSMLDRELATLRKENDELKNSNENSWTSGASLRTSSELVAKIAQKEAEIRQLSAMIDVYKEKTAGLTETSAASLEKTMTTTRDTLRSYELDIQERDLAIASLKNDVDAKSAALNEANKTISNFDEKATIGGIKQDAIKMIISKRDAEISSLEVELDMIKKDLKNRTAEYELLKPKALDSANEAALAIIQVREREEEIYRLKKEIETIRKDITRAQEVATTKDISKTKLEAEIARLEDVLRKRDIEIADLQARVEATKR